MLDAADLELISQQSLFADLEKSEFQRFLDAAEEKHYPADHQFFREGDPRDFMRVILSGRIELNAEDTFGIRRPLISYGRGDMIGEGVLLEKTVHTTSARAETDVRVLEIHRDDFAGLIGDDHRFECHVLKGFVRSVVGRVDQIRHQAGPEVRSFTTGQTRTEKDLIGELEVPLESYYGVQTARALSNFEITGVPISRYGQLIVALAMVKIASAKANAECGALETERADAIVKAGLEIVRGHLHDHFPVDLVQGGAGTSTNMNANEVIANRALEMLGHPKGSYEFCHPNNDVNASQSTNDVYPTALKIAMASSAERLIEGLEPLISAFDDKGREFASIIKMGRTQLQDAVPMTLGQEFRAFAASLRHEVATIRSSAELLLEINMGGTAIGTGLNAPEGYSEKVVRHLSEVSGLDLFLADNLIESTQSTQGFVMFSSALKSLAVKISKIASDLRLLSSGPRAGLNEINLPAKQPGSSIMPGKVNPVIPEVVNQVAYRVIGNDLSVTMAAEGGQLQLNVMEPVIAASILDSVEILSNAVQTFRVNCVEGIVANQAVCHDYVENSIGLVTALVPVLGYTASSRLAKEAQASGRGIVELVREQGLLDENQIRELLAPENMAGRE